MTAVRRLAAAVCVFALSSCGGQNLAEKAQAQVDPVDSIPQLAETQSAPVQEAPTESSRLLPESAFSGKITYEIDSAERTLSASINSSGQIVGTYESTEGDGLMGYLREPNGDIEVFEVPGAGSTVGLFINDSGVIAGEYWTGDVHGIFLRSASGDIASVHENAQRPVYLKGFNNDGQMIANYGACPRCDRAAPIILLPDGSYTEIQIPDALAVSLGGINNRGDVAGVYEANDTSPAGAVNGFVKTRDGKVSSFALDALNSSDSIVSESWEDVTIVGITDSGVVVGNIKHKDEPFQAFSNLGFIRTHEGMLSLIDPPGASSSRAITVNEDGLVGGLAIDSTKKYGFTYSLEDDRYDSYDDTACDLGGIVGLNEAGIAIGFEWIPTRTRSSWLADLESCSRGD